MSKILITGSSGYIGGSLSVYFKTIGHEVHGVDRVYHKYLSKYFDTYTRGDYVDTILPTDIDVIIHCAGTSLVGPSVYDPGLYYDNNVRKTIILLNKVLKYCPQVKFIFSSSGSVYKSKENKLDEKSKKEPKSPYAKTKFMIENIITDFDYAYNLKYVIFRYFNACGAMYENHGQKPGATHIFPKLFNSDKFILNGTDFETRDGTCVRDYVSIVDLCKAHELAIEKNVFGIYNIGNDYPGYSNKQIIDFYKEKVNPDLKVVNEKRRKGDVPILIANTNKIKKELGWQPKDNLNDIIYSLNKWYNSDTYMELKKDG
jgi:UDP-glucose 4-epimerase